MFGFGSSKKLTEQLYSQNLELAVKNKTLALLEKLYQASVLNLTPEEMAVEITGIICKDLNLELAGVLIFEKKNDRLVPLAFSKSKRLVSILKKLGFLFKDLTINHVSKVAFFKPAIFEKRDNATGNLQEVWDGLIPQRHLQEIKKETHIKTILCEPLIINQNVSGVLLLGLNRSYDTLTAFEKASIKNFINVIGLLLDKAYLYKNLQASYEVEKRAHEIEKKAKEELEKLDKFKDQFLMTTQHNLRTPLTSMMGYSDLILNGTFGKQNKKTTDIVKKFQMLTQGMIKMVNDFLDMAQFQLGKSVITLKPGVELWPILDELMNELKFKADSKSISLELQKTSEPLQITADREKLKAALFNIIDNSVKYTEKGGVTINVMTNNQNTINNKISNFKFQISNSIVIVIHDSGIGIPPEKVNTIFDSMFERTEQAKKVSAVGSGVGLYLSGQIIKAHKGKFWAESGGEGKGSTFYVELPL